MTFDAYYPANPWANVDKNQRNVYIPALYEVWKRAAIYAKFVTTQFNNGAWNAPEMTITSLVYPHANFDPIGLRDLWLPSSYMDSFARKITFKHYGAKVSYHKYDDLITYWQQNGAGGLRRIVQAGLAQVNTEIMDNVARNAFLYNVAVGNGYGFFGDGSGTDFSDIGTGDILSTQTIKDIHLGMSERDVPYASNQDGNIGNILCITSPGAIYGIRSETGELGTAGFVPTMLYHNPSAIIQGEQFTYQNVRFIQTPRAILYNSGDIVAQTTVTDPINEGDGTDSTTAVDGAYYVGQSIAAHKSYITVDDVADLAVNDIISIHVTRTDAYGITNGVDFREGTLQHRRIVGITALTKQIVLDKPLMVDMNVDLGAGVYAYVTKAKHVHTATFIGGSDGVVMGVGNAPQLHIHEPMDDTKSMYRFVTDGYYDCIPFEPKVLEVGFFAGRNRIKGAAVPA
ncbi:MAG: hypothetical protein HC892_00265 [Saprospiraceae bacterium]|nr:hypothetical protein [Saprospiraceae bacterium]